MIKRNVTKITTVFLTLGLLISSRVIVNAETITGKLTGEEVESKINNSTDKSFDFSSASITGGFTVTRPGVTLNGNGAVIDGNDVLSDAVVTIKGSNVTFNKFTFTKADGKDDIVVSAPNVTLNKNTFNVGSKTANSQVNHGYGVVTDINANNINLKGNTFNGDTGFSPFYIDKINNTSISNNKLNGHFEKHASSLASIASIFENTFNSTYYTDDGTSLYIEKGSKNVKITGNTFKSKKQKSCITLDDTAKITISENTFNGVKTSGFKTKKNNGQVLGIVQNQSKLQNVSGYKENSPAYFGTDTKQIKQAVLYLYDPTGEAEVSNNKTASNTTSKAPSKAKKSKETIINAKDKKIALNSEFDIMKGVTAFENNGEGLDITNKIKTVGSVDTETPGDYTITYKVKDQYGNKVEKTVTITVKKDKKKAKNNKAENNTSEIINTTSNTSNINTTVYQNLNNLYEFQCQLPPECYCGGE